jgi:RimJ/RimL family protein N-acetyltransferase
MRRTEPLPRIAGELVLRRLAVSDLAAFQAYRNDAVLGQYQGWAATSDAEAMSFLREMSTLELLQPGAWSQIAIAKSHDQVVIGDIGLFVASDGRQAEIGFTLKRELQRHGLATAAVREAINLVFEQTQAAVVLGITDARNLRSIRLLERVGMHKTETRSTVFRGEQCLEHVYAVPRAK